MKYYLDYIYDEVHIKSHIGRIIPGGKVLDDKCPNSYA